MSQTTIEPLVHIDPAAVPDCEYRAASAVLASSIRLALADPALRKEYEDWKLARNCKTNDD